MEVWREPDDVRILVAQERLTRERPLRIRVTTAVRPAPASKLSRDIRWLEAEASAGVRPAPVLPGRQISKAGN